MKPTILSPLAVACASIIALSSCTKTTTPIPATPDQPVSLKIMSIIKEYEFASGSHYAETFTLHYDAQDRIATIEPTLGLMDEISFEYPGSNKIQITLTDAEEHKTEQRAFLNEHSLLDSTFQFDASLDTTTAKYFYDADQHLIGEEHYEYYLGGRFLMDKIAYSYNTAGNLLLQSGDGTTIRQHYDSVVTATPYVFLNFLSISKQLPTRQDITSPYGDYTISHFYDFDQHNRLVRDRAISTNGNNTSVSYAYPDAATIQ